MEVQEYDIVLRNISQTDNTYYRLVVVGHEDEMTYESETTMGCIRQLNIDIWNKSYMRRQREDKALNSLRDQLRKDAGIRWFHFGRKKVPSELRARMDDVVAAVCKENPKFTYEEAAAEVLRRWNECPKLDNLGHECGSYCHKEEI